MPIGLSVLVLVVVLALSAAVLARHRAGSAADLAALAAAGRGRSGATPDCLQAARVAGLNGGRLTECEQQGDGSVVVSVQVRVHLGELGTGFGPARGTARAGPCLGC